MFIRSVQMDGSVWPFENCVFDFFDCCCAETCSTESLTWSGGWRWAFNGETDVLFQSTFFWQFFGRTATGKKKDPPSLSLHRMKVVWISKSGLAIDFFESSDSIFISGFSFDFIFAGSLLSSEAWFPRTSSETPFSTCSQTSTTVSAPRVWSPENRWCEEQFSLKNGPSLASF